MNCREVKKILIRYIEKSLDKNTSEDVKKHLSSCKDCSAEAASLLRYINAMSLLKMQKAPADFMLNLNARLEKRSRFSGILKALFFPVKIKIPLEAAGVFASVVLILLFFYPSEKIEKSVSYPEKPSLSDVQRDEQRVKRAAPVPAGKDLAQPIQEKVLARVDKKEIGGSVEKIYEIALLASEIDTSVETAARESGDASYPKARMQTDVHPAESIKIKSAAGAAEETEKRDDSLATADKAPLEEYQKKVTSEKQDRDLAERKIHNTELQYDSYIKIKNIAQSMNGKVIEERPEPEGAIANFIVVEIPSTKAKEFMERLKTVGSVKMNTSLSVPYFEKSEIKYETGNIRFRIELIHQQ